MQGCSFVLDISTTQTSIERQDDFYWRYLSLNTDPNKMVIECVQRYLPFHCLKLFVWNAEPPSKSTSTACKTKLSCAVHLQLQKTERKSKNTIPIVSQISVLLINRDMRVFFRAPATLLHKHLERLSTHKPSTCVPPARPCRQHAHCCLLSSALVHNVPGTANAPEKWEGKCVHSSIGSGEQTSTLTPCSWDSQPCCIASWEGCDSNVVRKRGLFFRMTCACVAGPRKAPVRSSFKAKFSFLEIPHWTCSVSIQIQACTSVLYVHTTKPLCAYECVLLFSPPAVQPLCVCMGSIVTMCVLSLHSSVYFRGNDLTNRSTGDLISGSFFFCFCREECSVTVKHLEGLSRPESLQTSVHIRCTSIHESYDTPPTDLVKQTAHNLQRWFTDELRMNHTLFLIRRGLSEGPDTHTHLLIQMAVIKLLYIYRQ